MTDLSRFSKVKQEHRSTLFYNKYKYRAKFNLLGASRTYYVRTLIEFEQRILELKDSYKKYGDYSKKLMSEFDSIDRAKIVKLLDLKEKYYYEPSKVTGTLLVTEQNTIKVYTNDLAVIDEFIDCEFEDPELVEAIESIAKDVKLFANPPQHNFRVYFKERGVENDFKDSLKRFIESQSDVYPCQSLTRWLSPVTQLAWKTRHLQQSYFIDFDDESTYTLLLLYFGGQYIRKYYQLKQK